MNHLRSRIKALAVPALVLPLLPLTALAASSTASAAPTAPSVSASDVWSPTEAASSRSLNAKDVRVTPSRAAAYTLDADALDTLLDRAPSERSSSRGSLFSVPAPNGDLVDFRIVESPIMAPGLAAAHPEIKTYAGRAVSSPATIRLDVTKTGFHASVRGAGATWYVDPQVNGAQSDDSVYLSYRGADLDDADRKLVEPDRASFDSIVEKAGEAAPGDAVIHRTYRLALVTDPSYARYFGTANVLSEKVTLMNRVNQIYNDDLAIKMVMIDETDKLNLDTDAKAFGADGPCGSAGCFTPNQFDGGCVGSLLNRNQFALGEIVGPENYDIGHIMLGINGGGVAGLGVVGGNGKARGCTGLPQPEGDFMAIDYVAHEMGHQFGGNHTFNGTQYNCGGNKAAPSVEPGSGSSVMAYAGICQQDNLQPHTDPYFSQWTQQEVSAYITSTPTVNEVQSVTLDGFDTDGESFTLSFGDATTVPITRGVDYNTTAIRAAINAIVPVGGTVSVAALGGSGSLTDKGFQITFGGGASNNLAGVDHPNVVLNPGEGVTGGHVTETTKGAMRTNGGNDVVTTENHAPVVETPATTTIPTRTPFALTGSASDADGDHMLYLWEQADRGAGTGTALVNQTKTNGPLFRVFGTYANVTPAATLQINSPGENLADDNPTRVFPDMEQILANNTNADTGKCPDAPAAPATGGATNVPVSTIDCFSEWLPTADYVGSSQANNQEPSLNFRFTARDLDPEAGGYGFGNTKVIIDPTAGPFLISSKNAPAAAVGGRTEAVNWTVNGTNKPGLAENVKISLSTDGGHTFPITLVESTPNDGSEPVVWPNLNTDHARIKVEAVDNIFFDVNNADFQIVARQVPDTTIENVSDGSVMLTKDLDVNLSSTVAGATYECTLDGDPVDCAEGTASLTELAAGTHLFTAAASAGGLTDESPASVAFTTPLDDRELTRAGKGWSDVASDGAFAGTLSKVAHKGSSLKTTVTDATALYLIAPKAKNYGKVSVSLNGKVLKKVTLSAKKANSQAFIKIAQLASPTSGNLVIKTLDKKQVRIDALAVVADVAPKA